MNTADSIRVWQGFMNEEFQAKQSEFYQLLGSVFIPVTSQIMTPLGLQAYFPGILPYSSQQMPDEIALVVYPSQETYYDASRETVIGRAYGKLHGDVFNFSDNGNTPASWSKFPVKYANQTIQAHDCYYLSGASLDWSSLSMRCLCLEYKPSANDLTNTTTLIQSCHTLLGSENVSEIIISVGETYCLVWICSSEEITTPEPLQPSCNNQAFIDLTAQTKAVHPLWTLNDNGLAVSPENLYNITLTS